MVTRCANVMLQFLVRCSALPPSTQLYHAFFSTSTSVSSSGATSSLDPHFLVEYLMDTCGFSVDDTSKVSKLLPRIESSEKPNVVLGFFISQGLDEHASPQIEDLGKFIWIEGDRPQESPEEWMVFSNNIENVVRPNMNFLRDECGIPEDRVPLVIKNHPGFIMRNLDALRALVDRADKIGIPRGSGMLLWNPFFQETSNFFTEFHRDIAEKDGIFYQGGWDCTFRQCLSPVAFRIKFGKEGFAIWSSRCIRDELTWSAVAMLHIHSLVRGHALLPSIQFRRLFFSTGASATSSVATASPDPNFLVEYLMNACGFSADDASKVSKSFPRFRSAEKADAVLGFLRSQGIDGANLRKIISWKPGFLCRDVENSLAPKFKILRDMGLSESDIANAVLRHPILLYLDAQNALLPRLKVWESLFGSREILLRNLQSYNRFMSTSIENVVRPNLNFLRDECGIPEDRVSRVIKRHPGFIVQNPESLRALVDRAEGIGIPRESKMFLWILDVLHGVSREKFEVQVKLLHSFGWSNSDFTAAFKKRPAFLWHSTEVLQRKMEFFIKDVEIKPSEIANHPIVLAFSLEKRLIPRFQLMKILKSEGLWTSNIKLHNFFSSPDPKFLQSFVLPYKDKLPELAEVKGNNPNCKFI
ncbi:hypothetical protein ZIOFF_060954 [Zingiber officinale]|uniref:Uncharacterized protein n=2 Tax=Zingiber officinale TaxID=94328 RepID=A0A8J5KLG0_ZINOF|nr:hypothetical protein ZIOFF_060954 [Zingiber officinale]